MGKNKHSKDRLYVTRTEHNTLYGGRRARGPSSLPQSSNSRASPPDTCALTQKRCESPVMSPDGTIFEVTAIIPWLIKHGNVNPVSGEKLNRDELVDVKFDKDDKGELRCPVLRKGFGMGKVVCVKKTGYVYSWEAVETLNLKARFMCDLLTGEKFRKDDIVVINDVKECKAEVEEKKPGSGDQIKKTKGTSSSIKLSGTALSILERVGKEDNGFRKVQVDSKVTTTGKRRASSTGDYEGTKKYKPG